MIIGRHNERETLQKVLDSKQAEFVAVYGRRRVGKTFMIKQYYGNVDGVVFFNVTGMKDGSMSEQLRNFADRISETFYGGINLEAPRSWLSAFKLLNQAVSRLEGAHKVLVFMDELPWMATPRSKLLQAIDYYWNQYWSDNPIFKLIICGSSASWIIDKIIQNRGGLHNRLTESIHLEPYSLTETRDYLIEKGISLTTKQIALIYMVTGGVPYYLSKLSGKGSAVDLIARLAFSKKSFLLDEFDKLFASLFRNHQSHVEIVRLLSSSRSGIGKNRILKQLGLEGGTGTKKLRELEDAGFIMQFKPIFHKDRYVYYRLTDEYTSFYLKWLEPTKTQLQRESLDKNTLQALQVTPEWHTWMGYAFESLCYKHIAIIRRVLNLSPLDIPGTWRYVPKKGSDSRGAQIDLLFDCRDDTIRIFEIKCTDGPFVLTRGYRDDLLRKIKVFREQTRTKKNILIYFVSATGLKEGDYTEELVCDYITLDQLFED